MSIKSDKWIRRMASQHGLIEPFEPGQVRTGEDGRRLISYGTSSYGYDVRCAREFKIFTNINSTIVDPKQFDEKSFVDVAADVCIIPPNSFALARTIEYFRIPRNVLTVCLGKCVTGDTRVVDADTGAYLPITEMRFGKSTLAWNGRRLERAKVSGFIPQGRREVFELRTRAGLKIRATANHPFLTLQKWMPLSELRVGDRIAVARDIPVFGKTPIPEDEVRRLGREALDCVPQSVFMAPEASVRLFLQSLFGDEVSLNCGDNASVVQYHSSSPRLIEDVHHLLLRFGIFSLIREEATQIGTRVYKIQITDGDQALHFAERIGFLPVSGEVSATIGMATSHVSAGGDIRVDELNQSPMWDTIEQIASIGTEEVFDITVPKLHNFVANGFIVHNSTYARCFSGDTRVALVDGTSATLEEMARGFDAGQLYWGYSLGEGGRIIVTMLDRPRFIGRDALLELTLDNGEVVRATPDHMFWRRDGRKAAAAELRAGDSLMPLYRSLRRGYEQVYQPVNGHLYPTHRLADECNLRSEIYTDEPGTHRHHIDINRRNNRPDNLIRMEASEHIQIHNAETFGPDFDGAEHGALIQEALDRLSSDPAWRENYSRIQAERARGFWTDEHYAQIRAHILHERRNPSDARREAHRIATQRRFADPAARVTQAELMREAWAKDDGSRRRSQAQSVRTINLRSQITLETVRAKRSPVESRQHVWKAAEYQAIAVQIAGRAAYRSSVIQRLNHKIAAIRELPGVHDVYCLTVPEAGNFALEAGVFVDNCGIIVNVTPLEPEWEGHVTLEFSNTTPLPAKIYANEGVAQMLFFESDEICETSYADRGGKYQKQRGVTLPKA